MEEEEMGEEEEEELRSQLSLQHLEIQSLPSSGNKPSFV